jgi:O-antigen/teichoic acid export membrane protein
MIKKTIHLFFSKVIVAVLNFLLLLYSARLLGAESRGIINLLVVNLSIIVLFSELFSGPVLVYFSTRINNQKLKLIAGAWNFVSSCMVVFMLKYFNLGKDEFYFELLVVSILYGNLNIYQLIFTGLEKINALNFVLILNSTLQLILFFITTALVSKIDVHVYFISWILALGISNLVALSISKNEKIDSSEISYLEFIKDIFKKSKWIFLDNLLHLLAVRIIYFFIESSYGNTTLGIMGTGVSLSESLLLISSSISTVLYSRISNINVMDKPNELLLCNAGFWISFIGWMFLIVVPESFWSLLIGKDFYGIKMIFVFYGPSVLLMVLSTIISNFYSGNGNYKTPAIGSAFGLFFATVLSILLIKKYGIIGAMISAFFSNLFQLIWLFYYYKKSHTNIKFVQMLRSIFNPFQLKHLIKV